MNTGSEAIPGRGASEGAEVRCWGIPADPVRFPSLRRLLAGWAEHVGMSAEQVEALALASYEALANAAAHAYSAEGAGVLDVEALHRPGARQVQVTVTDYGRWQPEDTQPDTLGGRGLLLIESLADRAEITSTVSGTSVHMCWTMQAQPAASQPGQGTTSSSAILEEGHAQRQ